MASLERINYQPMCLSAEGEWIDSQNLKLIKKLPLVFWSDGEPWIAANKFAFHKISGTKGNDLKTVEALMKHIAAYATWLEEREMDWKHFPIAKRDRCLFRFRGWLIEQRELDLIAPSTASARMAAVIQFYRFTQENNLIQLNLWDEHKVSVQFYNIQGFTRTMAVGHSELSIPNRKRHGLRLEGGLLPVSIAARNQLLKFLHQNGMEELYLMHMISFFTGARSETIRTLKVNSIDNTLSDSHEPRIRRLPVGPGTTIQTKHDVSGNLIFTYELITKLQAYAYSIKRVLRQAKATNENKSFLFLTRSGKPYSEATFTKLMSMLRKKLMSEGLDQFQEFKFHQCRATFGTLLMEIALKTRGSNANAVAFVRDAMLHKYESTTWQYVRFIEQTPLKEKYAEEFFNIFTGAFYEDS